MFLSAIHAKELSYLLIICEKVVLGFVANLEGLRLKLSFDKTHIDRVPGPVLPFELEEVTMSVFHFFFDSKCDILTAICR